MAPPAPSRPTGRRVLSPRSLDARRRGTARAVRVLKSGMPDTQCAYPALGQARPVTKTGDPTKEAL